MSWFHQRRPASGGLLSGRVRGIWDDDAGCLVPVVPLPKVTTAGLIPDQPVPNIPGVISLDTRPIMRALKQISDRIAKISANPAVMAAVRRQYDRDHIRRVADRELREARAWLDDHVDSVYADLGMERPS